MLSERYLQYLDSPENPVAQTFGALEETIIRDIIRRIAKSGGQITPTAEYQTLRLMAMGELPEDILEEIQKALRLSEKQFDAMLDDAVERSDRFNVEIAGQMGKALPPAEDIPFLRSTIDALKVQTKEEFRNITRSMGFLGADGKTFLPVADFYQKTLDLAAAQTASGAFDYAISVRQAARMLASSGLRYIDYASGHRDSVEVAVRRATITGVSQVANQVSTARMDDLETDLVEVSAHGGARNTGAGPANHASWQGKVYRWRRSGHPQTSRGRYEDFMEKTGYGSGEGLGGWNCRHSFYPFVEGVSAPTYTTEQLRNIDPKPFPFEGKIYKAYDASQRQRQLERNIRYSKKCLFALEEGLRSAPSKEEREKVQKDYGARAVKLQMQRQKYREFCHAGHLPERNNRQEVVGFGRSQSARATAATRAKRR